MASEAVLNFLTDHNRPFSLNEIQQGSKGDFGKTAIQKALDALVETEHVKEKVYGKHKVYCVVQKTDVAAGDLRENLLEVDRKVNETTAKLGEITQQLKAVSNEFSQTKGKITLEEAVDQKLRLEKELSEVKGQLAKYSETTEICPKKKLEADKDYEKYLNEYRKRKRMAMDIVNSILENYPKTKKHLFDDIGMETDEEVGFSVDKT